MSHRKQTQKQKASACVFIKNTNKQQNSQSRMRSSKASMA